MLLLSIATSLFMCAFGSDVNNACSNLLSYPFSAFSRDCYHNFDVFSDVYNISARHGYIAQSFEITTKDGYVLTVFRIHSKNVTATKAPVFLQHGLFGNCLAWIDKSKQSFAFWLADRGYKVWLGNFRGSTYSQKHVKYNVDNQIFWNFTIDTIAKSDLMSMLDFVASKSNEKIIYIGHSMATTTVFMLASRFPSKTQNLLQVIIALSPNVYMDGAIPILTTLGLPFVDFLFSLNIKGIFYQENAYHNFFTALAKVSPLLMNQLYNFLFGFSNQFPADYLILLLSHFPSGNSLYQFKQYFQYVKNNQFQMYDFGKEENLQYYGTEKPPLYYLANVKIATHLVYATNDLFYIKDNIIKLYNELGTNTKSLQQVGPNSTDYKFNHMDFLYGKDLGNVLYEKIVLLLE